MGIENFNVHLFKEINSIAGSNPYLDVFMIFSAQYLIFIIPIYLLYLWFKKDKEFSLYIFISVIITLLISTSIGALYYHPRPFSMGLGTQLIGHASDSSFPSDHTTAMFAFALPFLFFKRYREGIVFVSVASLVGFARVFCGVHFPLDIIGGFIVAILTSFILYIFKKSIFYFISKATKEYQNILAKIKNLKN